MKNKINYILTGIFLILLDQLIKFFVIKNLYEKSITIIPNILKFTYVENTGGAFGLGKNGLAIIILINTIILGLIVYFTIRNKEKMPKSILSVILLIGVGGLGNLIDRIFRGFVIDFIDVNPIIKFPMFNFADIYVVVGCVLLMIMMIISDSKKGKVKSHIEGKS